MQAVTDLHSKLGALLCLSVCLDAIKTIYVDDANAECGKKSPEQHNGDAIAFVPSVPHLTTLQIQRLTRVLWMSFDDKSMHAVRAAAIAYNTLLDIVDAQQQMVPPANGTAVPDKHPDTDYRLKATVDLLSLRKYGGS
jgi:hypothetical protein